MFLNELDDEEKKYFLELASIIASCNDDSCEGEKSIIKEYRKEMQLGEDEWEIKNIKLEDILEYFNSSDIAVKNAVLLEAIEIVISDKNYDSCEKKIIEKIKDSFNVSDEKFMGMLDWVSDLNELYNEGYKIVKS